MLGFVNHGQCTDHCHSTCILTSNLACIDKDSRYCWVCTFHSGQHSLVTFVFISTDAVAFSNAHFGGGTGTIHLDEVNCIGSETNLTHCSHSSTVSCFRGHSDDAGVRCQGWINDKLMLHFNDNFNSRDNCALILQQNN